MSKFNLDVRKNKFRYLHMGIYMITFLFTLRRDLLCCIQLIRGMYLSIKVGKTRLFILYQPYNKFS